MCTLQQVNRFLQAWQSSGFRSEEEESCCYSSRISILSGHKADVMTVCCYVTQSYTSLSTFDTKQECSCHSFLFSGQMVL